MQESKVKRHLRKGKVVNYHTRKNKQRKKRVIAVGTVAATGGSIAAIAVLRKKYRAGIPARAAEAIKKSKGIKVPDIPANDLKHPQINLTVGGLTSSPETKSGKRLAKEVKRIFKGYTLPFDTSSYNKLKPTSNKVKAYADSYKVMLSAFARGRNPAADELAATVLAYQKKYPNNTIVMHGHSFGGSITNEAMALLAASNANLKKIKQVTYGTSYYGVIPQSNQKNSLHLINDTDIQASKLNLGRGKRYIKTNTPLLTRFKSKKEIPIRYGHSQSSYLGDRQGEAVKEVRKFLEDKSYSPPSKEKPIKKKKVKPNRSKSELNRLYKKYRELQANKGIPKEAKAKVLANARKQYKEAAAKYRRQNG